MSPLYTRTRRNSDRSYRCRGGSGHNWRRRCNRRCCCNGSGGCRWNICIKCSDVFLGLDRDAYGPTYRHIVSPGRNEHLGQEAVIYGVIGNDGLISLDFCDCIAPLEFVAGLL